MKYEFLTLDHSNRYNITVVTYVQYGVASQMMVYLRTAINPFLIGMPTYIKNAQKNKNQITRSRGTTIIQKPTTLRKSTKSNGVKESPALFLYPSKNRNRLSVFSDTVIVNGDSSLFGVSYA